VLDDFGELTEFKYDPRALSNRTGNVTLDHTYFLQRPLAIDGYESGPRKLASNTSSDKLTNWLMAMRPPLMFRCPSFQLELDRLLVEDGASVQGVNVLIGASEIVLGPGGQLVTSDHSGISAIEISTRCGLLRYFGWHFFRAHSWRLQEHVSSGVYCLQHGRHRRR
jgi:hypothetical protein